MLNQLQRSVVAPGGANGRSSEEEPIPTLDMLESQKQVKRVVHYLEQRVDNLRDLLDQRDKTLNLAFQFKDWKRNIKTVSSYHSHLPVVVISMFAFWQKGNVILIRNYMLSDPNLVRSYMEE